MNAIGAWVKRPRGKWHLTESVVAEAAITHCGRRLKPWTTDQHSDAEPFTRMIGQPQLCKMCS